MAYSTAASTLILLVVSIAAAKVKSVCFFFVCCERQYYSYCSRRVKSLEESFLKARQELFCGCWLNRMMPSVQRIYQQFRKLSSATYVLTNHTTVAGANTFQHFALHQRQHYQRWAQRRSVQLVSGWKQSDWDWKRCRHRSIKLLTRFVTMP